MSNNSEQINAIKVAIKVLEEQLLLLEPKKEVPRSKTFVYKNGKSVTIDSYSTKLFKNTDDLTIDIDEHKICHTSYLSSMNSEHNSDLSCYPDVLAFGAQIKDHLIPEMRRKYYLRLASNLIHTNKKEFIDFFKNGAYYSNYIFQVLYKISSKTEAEIDIVAKLYHMIPEYPELQSIVCQKIRGLLDENLVAALDQLAEVERIKAMESPMDLLCQ